MSKMTDAYTQGCQGRLVCRHCDASMWTALEHHDDQLLEHMIYIKSLHEERHPRHKVTIYIIYIA